MQCLRIMDVSIQTYSAQLNSVPLYTTRKCVHLFFCGTLHSQAFLIRFECLHTWGYCMWLWEQGMSERMSPLLIIVIATLHKSSYTLYLHHLFVNR